MCRPCRTDDSGTGKPEEDCRVREEGSQAGRDYPIAAGGGQPPPHSCGGVLPETGDAGNARDTEAQGRLRDETFFRAGLRGQREGMAIFRVNCPGAGSGTTGRRGSAERVHGQQQKSRLIAGFFVPAMQWGRPCGAGYRNYQSCSKVRLPGLPSHSLASGRASVIPVMLWPLHFSARSLLILRNSF